MTAMPAALRIPHAAGHSGAPGAAEAGAGTSTSRHDTRRRGGGHGNEGQSNDARTRPSRCAVPPLAQPERPALITTLRKNR